MFVVQKGVIVTYLKLPSVLTDKSCRMNQTPSLLSGSVNLKALALKLPIRFLVNMPEPGDCEVVTPGILGGAIIGCGGGK